MQQQADELSPMELSLDLPDMPLPPILPSLPLPALPLPTILVNAPWPLLDMMPRPETNESHIFDLNELSSLPLANLMGWIMPRSNPRHDNMDYASLGAKESIAPLPEMKLGLRPDSPVFDMILESLRVPDDEEAMTSSLSDLSERNDSSTSCLDPMDDSDLCAQSPGRGRQLQPETDSLQPAVVDEPLPNCVCRNRCCFCTCRYCSVSGFDCPEAFVSHLRSEHVAQLHADLTGEDKRCYFSECSSKRQRWTSHDIQLHLENHFNIRKFACATCHRRFFQKKDKDFHCRPKTCSKCKEVIRCSLPNHRLVCSSRTRRTP